MCRGALEAKAAFRAPWLRDAFDAVDRSAFVPSRFWSQNAGADGLYPLIDRDTDPGDWLRYVWDPHASAVTQMDDGRMPEEPAVGDFTSSVSAADIVFEKLAQLDLESHHRVVELGTGSGYSTALLCERAGSAHVTTVEIDSKLAAWGEENLKRAGYSPAIVQGDALQGWPGPAPDRVIATASLRHVPYSWVQHCTPGAVILAPVGTCFANGALLKLTVHSDRAEGRFTTPAAYMWTRSERPQRTLNPPEEARKHTSRIDPTQVMHRSWAQTFAIGLRVPDIDYATRGDGDGMQAQFWDQTGESVTIVNYGEWWANGAVTCYGPRNLWAEVVDAYTAWMAAGQPDIARHGITVDATGQQAWVDDPGQSWRI